MKIEDRGLVFDAANRPPRERVAAFVGLCPLRSGSVICSFQLGARKHAPDGTIRLCRSRDGGTTWSELSHRFEPTIDGVPGSLSSGEIVEVEPGRLLLIATWFDRSDPERPLFDPETEGILPSRQLRAFSRDEGESWSDWEEIPVPGLRGCSSTGPLLHFADGTIAYPFESYKEYGDPAPAAHGAWLIVSRDGGRTFVDRVLVAQEPRHRIYYWDQRHCVGPGAGEYLAMFWTHDLDRKADLTVHFRRGSLTETDFDHDVIVDTRIPGQIAAPALLEDGRIVAFVVERGSPGTLTLWQSRDGGRTWPREESLVAYRHDERALLSQGQTDVDFKQYWEDMGKWSFGHPAIRPLADGRLLLAHYAGTPDCMSVHWVRVDPGR